MLRHCCGALSSPSHVPMARITKGQDSTFACHLTPHMMVHGPKIPRRSIDYRQAEHIGRTFLAGGNGFDPYPSLTVLCQSRSRIRMRWRNSSADGLQ